MDLSKIDKNFANSYDLDGMQPFNVNGEGFALYGLCRADGEKDFKRLPKGFAEKMDNQSVRTLYKNTSGIRVRFKTDSQRIILKCVLPAVNTLPHMPLTGTSCFDLYADGKYCNVFRPGINVNGEYADNGMGENGYASGYSFPDRAMREILIHFPLYNDVDAVYIALEASARLCPARPYANEAPVVFYGSSITQGGCASHPGNAYPAILSRRFDCDFVNLGFSGGCFAEEELAAYIAHMEKRMLVYDYDHNAPDADALQKTHERFFLRVREQCPLLPIILVSAADRSFGEQERSARRDVIYKTYSNAVQRGDRNVYFVDGATIYSAAGADFCTVDNTHPNDLGFWCMAQAIGGVMEKIFDQGGADDV